MARKCSSCGNNGHNSRTCSGPQRSLETNNGVCGGGGVRLFGVQLHVVGSSSVPSPMKKCFSMECLSSSAPAYYAAALAAAGARSSSPSASSSSSLVSVDEAAAEKVTNGYLSDGLMGSRAQERKKGVPWTEDEHRRFLAGLEKLGKGDWRGISRHFVTTRTPTQVASHAQKYFLRQSSLTQKKRRTSLFDVVENSEKALSCVSGGRGARLRDETSTMSETEFPALSLGISSSSSRATKPEHALPPSLLLALTTPPPRCSAAMSTSPPHLVAPRHHPSSLSLTTTTSKPPAAITSLRAPPPPDLELKISTAAARQTTDQAGPSPRTPPFFGTIRVT